MPQTHLLSLHHTFDPHQSPAMVSPGDYEDTQVLDSEPPSPPCDDDGDDGIDHDQHTVPLGDTLPLEDLTGETQALEDDLNCAAASSPEIDLWGETQVLDDYEETVAGSDDKGRDEDDCKPCPDGQKDEEVVVCSDASTDEEGAGGDHVSSTSQFAGGSHQSNHGSVRKNCASVRATSLRFSSLVPGHNITPNITDPAASTYFNNGTYSKGKNGAVGSQNGSHVGMEKWQNNTLDLTSLGTRAGELDLGHKIGNSQRCTQDYHRDEAKSRISNARAKKLFNEATPGWEETTSNADKVIAKADSSHLLISDYVVGGLSYVGSQEPGDQSQANALEIVNEFLLVNDVGSSQEFDTGKTDIVKSCPVSSAKGIQTLAIKADHRSSVGKAEIFDWIDSCEDEGGGEFFGKRKNALFEVRGRKLKSHGQPPKARHLSSGIAGAAVDKNGEKEGADPKTFLEMTSLTRSDSRLMLCNAPGNEKVYNSETKTKKNLFKSMDKPSNSKSLEQQLETTDVNGGEENIYDVGPDTQMAAEVMEALLHGSPVNYKMEDTHPVARKVTENSTKGTRKKRNTSKNISAKKGTATPYSEGFAMSSKRRKILSAKSTSGIPDLSRKHSSNTRVKSSLVDSTMEKRGYGTVEGHLNTRSSVNGNESSRSLEREKTSGAVDETFTKDVDNCLSSLNVQLSVNEELLSGEYGVYTSPVAHRTRHSRAVNLLKQTETSYTEGGKKKNGQIDVRTSGAVKREDQIVSEASAPVKAKRKGSDMVSDQTAVVGKEIKSHTVVDDSGEPHQEESKISSAVKYSLSYPKRKRTKHVISGDSYNNGNLSNPSVLISAVLKTTVQPSTRGKSKQFVKSVSEILASVKRKKRSISALKASKNVGMPLVTGNPPTLSGVRMKSSVNSPSFKPTLAKDSTECSVRPILHKAVSTDAADNGSMYFMTHSLYAEENVRVDESSKENVQLSELACSPPPKAIDAVSPVFMVQDPMRTPRNKSLSTSSIIRELIRLEASETSLTWKLKDSRRRKDMASVRVLFSHHLNDEIIKQQKKILARLGVPIASSMSEATHFVTDKFARTKNMLEAMALGKPVVTDMWLESCGQANCFIDERNYILRDAKKEKEIGFNMPVSLAQASRRPLLQGRRVFITPNAKPNRELLSSLVKAAQGQPLEKTGGFAMKDDEVPDDLLVLSCEEDYASCKPLLEKGKKVFRSELILNGIVIQKLDYERHRLFFGPC